MIILGINGYSAKHPKKGITHNSGAALVRDGLLIAAIDEERISRVKNDKDYPFGAIKAVLECADICIDDIDHIAVSQWSRHKFQSEMLAQYRSGLNNKPSTQFRSYLKKRIIDFPIRSIAERFRPRTLPKNLQHISHSEVRHHDAHATSAYYTHPWGNKRVLVFTLDSFGDAECGSVWVGEDGALERKRSYPFLHSIGSLYTAFTYHLGFKPLQHEGKIVGLAAYDAPDKQLQRIQEKMHLGQWDQLFDSELMQLSSCADRAGSELIFQKMTEGLSREQIASGLQAITEIAVTHMIDEQAKAFDCDHLVLAGGVFANVKLNQRIMDLDSVENIYVFPNMGDGGLAAGAALAEHARLNPSQSSPQFIETAYQGGDISADDAKKALESADLIFDKPDNLAQQVAQLLADGKVVARADGRMEYGPRALGNRTVMAACSDPDINRWLNDRFQRTEFMPFAPVILEEYAKDYFPEWNADHVAARFMTITYDASELAKANIPAAIHVDGTARPQVIRREDNPDYYDIIAEYEKITGIPSVINTSFNMHEEPIVASAHDAVRAYLDAKLDVLILGPYLVIR